MAVNKVTYGGNTLIDLTGDTVTPDTLIKNTVAHDASGNIITGTFIETDPTVPSWAKAATKPTYTKSEVGLGNVDNVKQYSASNPPPYPVTSVNGKTGAVSLTAADVSAVPTSRTVNGKALSSNITLSASDVGADTSGTASSVVSTHNTNASAHADIRQQISQLSQNKVDKNQGVANAGQMLVVGTDGTVTPINAGGVYVGDGDMPDGAVAQIIIGGSSDCDSVPTETTSIPNYIKAEATEVAKKIISTRSANSLVLLMATDIHQIASEHETHNNNRVAVTQLGMGMAELRKQTRPDAVVLLGDYVYNVTPLDKDQAIKAMKDVVEKMYDATNGVTSIWLDGNHDYYENDEADKDYRLTNGEHYALIGANNSPDVEVDVDNLVRNYGYIDFKKQRIRLIYLNTTDISSGLYSANHITNIQGKWLINEALDLTDKSDADNWGIVVCSHFPIYAAAFADLKAVLCAFADKSSGVNYGTSYNFEHLKGNLIATFHGHIHNFKVTDVTTDGGNTIKAICIPNSCPDRENPYTGDFQEVDQNGTAVAYPKTPNTAESTSFNAVIIDRDNNIIQAICYGAGYDRSIEFDNGTPVQVIINQIPISTDNSGAIYGGDYNGDGIKDGYQKDTRLGSDGLDRTGATGKYATGFIPCTTDDTLYFKNCSIHVANGSTQTYQELACYDASKTFINKRYLDYSSQMSGKDYDVDSNNYLTRYNCADLWTNTAFVRITGNYIGADSIITKNQPFE